METDLCKIYPPSKLIAPTTYLASQHALQFSGPHPLYLLMQKIGRFSKVLMDYFEGPKHLKNLYLHNFSLDRHTICFQDYHKEARF